MSVLGLGDGPIFKLLVNGQDLSAQLLDFRLECGHSGRIRLGIGLPAPETAIRAQ
jgi:hypothetical protein